MSSGTPVIPLTSPPGRRELTEPEAFTGQDHKIITESEPPWQPIADFAGSGMFVSWDLHPAD